MSFYFSISQIAKMAMKIETAGAKFYLRMAEAARTLELKKVFIALARAEGDHRRTFAKIAAECSPDTPREYSIDVMAMMQGGLDNLRENAFGPKTMSRGRDDISSALDVAIGAERASVLVYSHMRDSFTDEFTHVLQKIVQEEEGHLETLTRIKTGFSRSR